MEAQAMFGLHTGWYDYLSGTWYVYLMSGDMPENNDVIYSIDNEDGFKAMFEKQILGMVQVSLSRYADYKNNKSTLRMGGNALELEQTAGGAVTWAMFVQYNRNKPQKRVFITNKVGEWQDENAIVILDSLDAIDAGEKRVLKAVTIEMQEIMPAQEASGEE